MSRYTRCPHCDTAFVVREEHLQIADGNVRCGSCKSVFNAFEFMMELPARIEEEPVEESLPQVPMLEASSLQQNHDDPEVIQAQGTADLEPISDEYLEDEILIIPFDGDTHHPVCDINIDGQVANSDFIQVDLNLELSPEPMEDVELSEEDVAEDMDDDDLFAESLESLQLSETNQEVRETAVDNFIKPAESTSDVAQKLIWAAGALIFLIVLLGAIFWFKRFDLAKNEHWRPTIDKICRHVKCGIPVRRDIDKILLQNREVSYGEGLITVNMLLVNTATFAQLYPRVEMSFSDLDGNVLVTHLVLPAEYLRAELVGSSMPRNVPVYIEFVLKVDTVLAVGYEFKFL